MKKQIEGLILAILCVMCSFMMFLIFINTVSEALYYIIVCLQAIGILILIETIGNTINKRLNK